MKATAIAPTNIAFIKYWGKKDEKLRLPENGSVSMNLSNLITTTTVEFSENFPKDTVTIDGKQDLSEEKRVIQHLDRIRDLAKLKYKAKVVSQNNFPKSTGLSSSASGFAALTVAATKTAGLNLSEKELSILARQGSGSACRSIPSGFVEWLDGETSETSYAVSIFPPSYWEIADIVAIVADEKKEVSSTEGQKIASSSPFFKARLSRIKEKIKLIKKLIKEKNFPQFGELIESEALELHAIMLTSKPPLIYWLPGTVKIMRLVKKWRADGLPVYFTVNTGQDVHLICQKKDTEVLQNKLKKIKEVKKVIINFSAEGARISKNHLF